MPESSCSFSWVHRAPFCNGDVTPREKTFDLRILNRSWRTNDILPFRSRPWQAPSNFCPGSALSLKHEITQKKKKKKNHVNLELKKGKREKKRWHWLKDGTAGQGILGVEVYTVCSCQSWETLQSCECKCFWSQMLRSNFLRRRERRDYKITVWKSTVLMYFHHGKPME